MLTSMEEYFGVVPWPMSMSSNKLNFGVRNGHRRCAGDVGPATVPTAVRWSTGTITMAMTRTRA
ncbi:MAG: hypothetical protein R3E39_24185 [Anaerolineae bacterium]